MGALLLMQIRNVTKAYTQLAHTNYAKRMDVRPMAPHSRQPRLVHCVRCLTYTLRWFMHGWPLAGRGCAQATCTGIELPYSERCPHAQDIICCWSQAMLAVAWSA